MHDLEFKQWLKESNGRNRNNGYLGLNKRVSVRGISKADSKIVGDVLSSFTVNKLPVSNPRPISPSKIQRARKQMNNSYQLYFNQVEDYANFGSTIEDIITGAVRLDTSLTRNISPRRIFAILKELNTVSTSDIEKTFHVDYETAKRLSSKCIAVINALNYHLEHGNVKLTFNPYFEKVSFIDDFDIETDAKDYLKYHTKKAA